MIRRHFDRTQNAQQADVHAFFMSDRIRTLAVQSSPFNLLANGRVKHRINFVLI